MKEAIKNGVDGYYFDRASSRRGSESNQHYHTGFEIYYMKEGRCRYFIDDRSYDVISGDVIVIPMGVIHRTNYGSQPHSRLLINFTEEFIPESVRGRIGELEHLYRTSEITARIEDILLRIERECTEHDDEMTVDALRCYTGEIFFLLLRSKISHEEAKGNNALVEQVVKYIQRNYMHEIRLSQVARMLSVSAEHLSRLFKKSTGFGFNEYVTLVRLQKAEYMLKNEPGRSISEVAYACGFNDGNYFSYKFKQVYGIPPTKVRGTDNRSEN